MKIFTFGYAIGDANPLQQLNVDAQKAVGQGLAARLFARKQEDVKIPPMQMETFESPALRAQIAAQRATVNGDGWSGRGKGDNKDLGREKRHLGGYGGEKK